MRSIHTGHFVCTMIAVFGLVIVPAYSDSENDTLDHLYESDWDRYDDLIFMGRLSMQHGIQSVGAGNFDLGISHLNQAFDFWLRAHDWEVYLAGDDFDDTEKPSRVTDEEYAELYLTRAIAYLAIGDAGKAFDDALLSLRNQRTAEPLAIMAISQIVDGNKEKASNYYRVMKSDFPEATAAALEVREAYSRAFGEPVPE